MAHQSKPCSLNPSLNPTQITFPDWSRTGLVRGTTDTLGPVRARATPLKSRMDPVRDCPWFTYSKVKWTLPIRPYLNLVRVTMGHQGHARTGPLKILVCARSNPVIGHVRDLTRHSGQARTPGRGRYLGSFNPSWCSLYYVGFNSAGPSPCKSYGPTVAHANPRDLGGLTIWVPSFALT